MSALRWRSPAAGSDSGSGLDRTRAAGDGIAVAGAILLFTDVVLLFKHLLYLLSSHD
jgi:hypothetical protein